MNDLGRLVAVRQLLTSVGIQAAEIVAANTIDDLPVFGVRIKMKHAAELWRRLRARHQDTGLWRFLSDESPMEWAQWCSDRPGGRDRLTAALAASPSEVVDELIAAHRTGSHEHRIQYQPLTDYQLGLFDIDHTLELIDSEPPPPQWRKHSEIAGTMTDPDWLCLVPARAGFELPALLSTPRANDWQASRAHDRLTQEDHVGVLRSWHERFGAEVRYLDAVALGLVVAKPLTGRGEVARVAVEQYAYCDDLDQFIGEPHRVAQLQVPNTHWYFWWD
jgi:hypothetical protein